MRIWGGIHDIEGGNTAFTNLIENVKSCGFDGMSMIKIDNEFRLLDGNHRLGICLYSGIHKIRARMVKRRSKNDRNVDYFYRIGIPADKIQELNGCLRKIRELLFSSGDCFIALLPDYDACKDLAIFADIKEIYRIKEPYLFETTVFTGVLCKIRIDNPAYMISNGLLTSNRANQIEHMLNTKFSGGAYLSKSCLQQGRKESVGLYLPIKKSQVEDIEYNPDRKLKRLRLFSLPHALTLMPEFTSIFMAHQVTVPARICQCSCNP